MDILPEAKLVMVHSVGGFTSNLSLEDFFQPDVLFAVKHNNEVLTPQHGYPVRLVVPRLFFGKAPNGSQESSLWKRIGEDSENQEDTTTTVIRGKRRDTTEYKCLSPNVFELLFAYKL